MSEAFGCKNVLINPDCHFLAVLTVLVQSILEGRTDCPISGVFGAGKTRAAAAMIAGLLVMDPYLEGYGRNQRECGGACLRQAH